MCLQQRRRPKVEALSDKAKAGQLHGPRLRRSLRGFCLAHSTGLGGGSPPRQGDLQNGIFCRADNLLANAWRSSADRSCSAWSRPIRERFARPPPDGTTRQSSTRTCDRRHRVSGYGRGEYAAILDSTVMIVMVLVGPSTPNSRSATRRSPIKMAWVAVSLSPSWPRKQSAQPLSWII
jgi:hypothetical protein